MAGQNSDKGQDRKQAAESAAKVVLAKHPSVVAGSVPPVADTHTQPSSKLIDAGARNIGRGLQR